MPRAPDQDTRPSLPARTGSAAKVTFRTVGSVLSRPTQFGPTTPVPQPRRAADHLVPPGFTGLVGTVTPIVAK